MHPHTPIEDATFHRSQYGVYTQLYVDDVPQGEGISPLAVLGYDPMESATVEADLEDPVMRATFRLHLGKDEKNISPYMTGGALVNGRSLFDPGRYIKLMAKCVAKSEGPVQFSQPPRLQGLGPVVSGGAVGNRVVSWPAGHQAGDAGVLVVESANQPSSGFPTLAVPSGFFQVAQIGVDAVGGGAGSVTHIASATFAATTGVSGGTITIPACQVGDDLYVLVISRNHSALDAFVTCTDNDTDGDSWTLLGTDEDRKPYVFWKKATANTSGKTVSIAGGKSSTAGGLSVFRGGAAGNPTTNLAFERNTPEQTHAGFTPANADSRVCFAVFNAGPSGNDWNNAVVTSLAAATLGTLEPEHWSRFSTAGSDVYLIFTSKQQTGAPAATGAFTWSQVAAANTRSVSFAIKPATTAGSKTKLSLFGRMATSGSMPAVEVTPTGDHTTCQIITIRGTASLAFAGSLGIPAGDSVSTPTAAVSAAFHGSASRQNSLVVAFISHAIDTTAPQFTGTWSNPSLIAVSEWTDVSRASGAGGGYAVVAGIKAGLGSTGTFTGTLANPSIQASIVLLFNPPAPPPSGPQNFDDIPSRPVFVGRIDSANPAADGSAILEIQCRDIFADFLDTWIEPGPAYGHVAGDSTIDGVLPELIALCDESQASGGELLPDFAGNPNYPFVVLPPDPQLFIQSYFQQPMSLLQAMRDAGLQNGWDLRGRWGSISGLSDDLFVLTYYEPDRALGAQALVVEPHLYYTLRALTKSRAGVRNVIEVWPADPPRLSMDAEDFDSQVKYGRMYLGVSQDVASFIRTEDQALALATAILSDLKEPKVMAEVEMRLQPFVEVNDIIRLARNDVHHDEHLDVAISGFVHEFRGGGGTTILRTRDRPAAANSEWRRGEPQTEFHSSLPPSGTAPEGSVWTQGSSL